MGHLGDRNDVLPTVRGFDEWYGNLYHLNAEEEPENVDYPKDPAFKAKFGPRGVLHCFATDQDDATVDPRFGRVGRQRCEDTGPLTKKRMETVDEEVTAGAIDFMDKAVKDHKPFFVWWNSSRMHVFTHLKKESEGKTGEGIYADGMVEHDGQVGELLAELKKLGVDNNTIVMIPATMAPRSSRGLTAAQPRSVVRRPQAGKAPSESPHSSAGRASSSPAPSLTIFVRTKTWCRPCSPRRATTPSRKIC